jgi:2-methylisocitrate lyase-like PEP mutase family enzyme
VGATELPVSADLENGCADEPEDVAQAVRLAIEAGLAGCSIEDFSGQAEDPIYSLEFATRRVQAAVKAAHSGPVPLVLTARGENFYTAVRIWMTRSCGFRHTKTRVPTFCMHLE